MGLLRQAVLLTICWQLCHGSILAQSAQNAHSHGVRGLPRVARPTSEKTRLVRLFSQLQVVSSLRSRQAELDVDVEGMFGLLWLTTIDIPAISASHGLVFTGADVDSAPGAATPGTATEAFEQLEKTLQDEKLHPLEPWIQYASSRYDYARQHVRDHTCVLIKRERMGSALSDYQYLIAKSRYQQSQDERIMVPLSIYLHYFGPAKLKGRKVIYVAGQNENKILVRNGGRRFSFVKVKIDLNSPAALRESHYPITELGIDNVIKRLLQKAKQDMAADPQGENTNVEYFRDAKINKRSCLRVRVIHPQRQDGLSFHRAEIYVDDLLQMPIRIEAYDWPKNADQDPPLIEEFTYTNLKLNVGLKSADFLPRLLD